MLEHLRPVLRRSIAWVGGMDRLMLLSLLVAVIAIWVFINVAGEVLEGDTQAFDEWLLLSLRDRSDTSNPIGPRWVAEFARDITALGGVAVLVMVTATVAGYLWICRVYHAMWLLLASTLGGLAVSSMLKLYFDRPRPSVVPHLAHVSTASFPSGHSVLSAVVYLTLGALLARLVPRVAVRAYVLWVAMSLTFLIGISRVYLGVHYPTDVVAGWAVGLAWASLCWHAAQYLQRRGAVERNVEEGKP